MQDKYLIKKLLRERKWTYKRLTDAMGVSETSVKGYLNRGSAGMRCDTLIKILDAMDFEIIVRDRFNRRGPEWKLDNKKPADGDDDYEMKTKVRNKEKLKAYDPYYYEIMLSDSSEAQKKIVPAMFRKMDIKDDWLDMFDWAIEDLRSGGYITGKAQRSNPYYWEQQKKELEGKFPD